MKMPTGNHSAAVQSREWTCPISLLQLLFGVNAYFAISMGQTPTRPQKPEICSAITLTKMLTILCLCQTMEEGFAYYVNLQSTTGYIPSDDTFGAIVVQWAIDNQITKTRCSSSERSGMTTLMRYAALGGGSNIDVRDRLLSEIKNFGYNYHQSTTSALLVVMDWGSQQLTSTPAVF